MNSDIAQTGSMPNGNKSGAMQSFLGVNDVYSTDKTIGELKGLYLGGETSYVGSPGGRYLQVGATKSLDEGSPANQVPSLQLLQPGFWRFRWSVASGSHSVSVNAKQTDSGQRPNIIVKANPSIGFNNDVSGSAAASSGWVTIGPVSFSSTGSGVVWVELWNNCQNAASGSTWFDHIVTT